MYLELRSTPKALLSKKGGERSTVSNYVDTILRAIKDGEASENGSIRVRYIASINRSAPVEYA